MVQIGFRSVVAKLGMLGIYLLFLTVQINFRYTFPGTLSTGAAAVVKKTDPDKNHTSLQTANEEKQDTQKLRLNKRYLPQEFFEVHFQQQPIIIHFSEKPEQPVTAAQVILSPYYTTSSLRGPPSVSPAV